MVKGWFCLKCYPEDFKKEGLKAIHKVKKAFAGATVEEIENE